MITKKSLPTLSEFCSKKVSKKETKKEKSNQAPELIIATKNEQLKGDAEALLRKVAPGAGFRGGTLCRTKNNR